jgi:hypothetical protein
MAARKAILAIGLGLSAAPLPVLAQRLGTASDPDISFVRIVAALVLCVAAAFALAFLIAKRGRLSSFRVLSERTFTLRRPRRLKLIEALRISAHADLCLVTADETEYLLLCAGGVVQVLSGTPAYRNEHKAMGS